MAPEPNALFLNSLEIQAIQLELGKKSLMGRSIAALINDTDEYLAKGLDVPGHSPAGGYAHNKHQTNARYIDQAGRLFLITADQQYAEFVTNLLTAYADKYLDLGFQVQRNTNPPGRIFHQMLNEHFWMFYAGAGYSCVSHVMTDAQRQHIIKRLFEPMLEVATEKYGEGFDRIHNHGIWGVAAVASMGGSIGQEQYLDLALHGNAGDDISGGFLAQLSLLFAPSGYYIEGPYYHRLAIKAVCFLAEQIHRARPDVDIYHFKDQILRKTIKALFSTAYPDGVFPALNDASKSMSITDEGAIVAASVFAKHYPEDKTILGIAKIQDKVWVSGAGLALSSCYENNLSVELPYMPSIELNEGPDGDKGAQGFIRMRNAHGDVTQLIMAYGQHGMGHGHFDTLGVSYFNNNQEVLVDYGFGRWLNVERKFGGRYLDENKTYARQTIAHNVIAVDEGCQNNAALTMADAKHGTPHFFIGNGDTQGMSAFAYNYHPGVDQQRSLLLVEHEQFEHPLLIDLFRVMSDSDHQYDYALQYQGQIMHSSVDMQQHASLSPLGENYGYQHLWHVAQGAAKPTTSVTWLHGPSFYTWLSACSEEDTLHYTRTGANDPSFNIRSEPSLVLRRKAQNSLFASVVETHGYFDEATETCIQSLGKVHTVTVLACTSQASVIEVLGENIALTVMVSNKPDVTKETKNSVVIADKTYRWVGYVSVESQ